MQASKLIATPRRPILRIDRPRRTGTGTRLLQRQQVSVRRVITGAVRVGRLGSRPFGRVTHCRAVRCLGGDGAVRLVGLRLGGGLPIPLVGNR